MNQIEARIRTVVPLSPTRIGVTWAGASAVTPIELADWIATGGEILSSLRDAEVFRSVRVGDQGASVMWGDDDSDLAIDAIHLKMMEGEQHSSRPARQMVGR